MHFKTKLQFKDTIRVFRCEAKDLPEAFKSLETFVSEAFMVNDFTLLFQDSEKDYITVQSLDDLVEALEMSEASGKMLKLYVSVKKDEKPTNEGNPQKSEEEETDSGEESPTPAHCSFLKDLVENEKFREEFATFIVTFLEVLKADTERDINAAFVSALSACENVAKHPAVLQVTQMLPFIIPSIQPFAIFLTAFDPSAIPELMEEAVKLIQGKDNSFGTQCPPPFMPFLMPLLMGGGGMCGGGGPRGFFGPHRRHGRRGGRRHGHRGHHGPPPMFGGFMPPFFGGPPPPHMGGFHHGGSPPPPHGPPPPHHHRHHHRRGGPGPRHPGCRRGGRRGGVGGCPRRGERFAGEGRRCGGKCGGKAQAEVELDGKPLRVDIDVIVEPSAQSVLAEAMGAAKSTHTTSLKDAKKKVRRGLAADVLDSELTLGDKAHLNPKQVAIKTWRVSNVGTVDWPNGTTIKYVGRMFNPMVNGAEFPVTPLKVGETGDATIVIEAPEDAGRYGSVWRLVTPNGETFGQKMHAKIVVVSSETNEEMKTEEPQKEHIHRNKHAKLEKKAMKLRNKLEKVQSKLTDQEKPLLSGDSCVSEEVLMDLSPEETEPKNEESSAVMPPLTEPTEPKDPQEPAAPVNAHPSAPPSDISSFEMEPPVPYKYQEQIDIICEMGFEPDDRVKALLEQYKGSVPDVTDALFR